MSREPKGGHEWRIVSPRVLRRKSKAASHESGITMSKNREI
jgi:hypothetical protein